MEDQQKTCFVVMGFGKKTDFETGRVLDLDKSYRNMIKPAVEAAGMKCIRADEIVHSGLIDVPMYEQLLTADVVVADLSTSNKNAFYELGIRHALRPYTTIIISEDGVKSFPFDVNHIAVRQYHHLGEDIGFDEVMRFRTFLTDSINQILKGPASKDSPVYSFIANLTPPAVVAAATDTVREASGSGTHHSFEHETETHSALMEKVDQAQKKGDWFTVKTLLTFTRQMMQDEIGKRKAAAGNLMTIIQKEDPCIIQRLALATYKCKVPNETDALTEAKNLLAQLSPDNSNDTETLGLWGAIHKRLWDLKKDRAFLDSAVRAYERGFYIRNDYYNGINLAFLLNVRAANAEDHGEAVADFVQARRIRREVKSICEKWLEHCNVPDKEIASPDAINEYLTNRYWVNATLAEAYTGLGLYEQAQEMLEEAYEMAPAGWMIDSTKDQLAKLGELLKNSPIKYLKDVTEA